MKPILPLVISLSLAAGLAPAQQIDLATEEPEPLAGEESAEMETPEEAAEEATEEATEDSAEDEPSADHGGDESFEETSEPTAEEPEVETDEIVDEIAGDETLAEITAMEDGTDTLEGEDDGPTEDAMDDEEEMVVETEPVPPTRGMAIRVERVHGGPTTPDPGEVELRAPFPAKLLAEVPEGWRIEKSDRAPAFDREVELSQGTKITLSVQPHILLPEADGAHVFAVTEPGYDAGLGYRQNATVGAILATSIRQLDNDARQLGDAIDQLQQLLVSLPRTEAAAQDQPAADDSKR